MSGIERRIDKLGRIVLPIGYRNKLGLADNAKVNILLMDNTILITPARKRCLMCGNEEDINKQLRLCTSCIERVKRET